MEKIIAGSEIVIVILCLTIIGSRSVIKENLRERCVVVLAILHSIIYWILKYACFFIQRTIGFNEFHRYPYKYPFCILAVIYCIISFIIIGIFYIKYRKNEYGIAKTVLFLFAIHILAILLVMFFSPFNLCF